MDCNEPSTCSFNVEEYGVCVYCQQNGARETDPYNCCGKHLIPNPDPSYSGLVCADCGSSRPSREYMEEFDEVTGGPSGMCPCIKFDVPFDQDPRVCENDLECCAGGVCDNTGRCRAECLEKGEDCKNNYNACCSSLVCKTKWKPWWKLNKNKTEYSTCKGKSSNIKGWMWVLIVLGALVLIPMLVVIFKTYVKNSAQRKERATLQQAAQIKNREQQKEAAMAQQEMSMKAQELQLRKEELASKKK